MLSLRVRALSASLAAVVVLSGCGKTATVVSPEWGTPKEALAAALEKLSEGFDYIANVQAATGQEAVNGSEIPGEDKLSIVSKDASATAVTRSVQIGDELWLKYEGIGDFPEEWGHLATGGEVFASGAGMIGPATWLPAFAEEIVEIERTGPLLFSGTLDLDAVDPQKTGIASYRLDSVDNADEVAFEVNIGKDGYIEHFEYTLEGPDGDLAMVYNFSAHGAATDVVAPTGEITELTPETMIDWLFGDLGE
ncbi:MAG TPA: hypothetical protein VGF17_26625 [Phytomonospora sp.]